MLVSLIKQGLQRKDNKNKKASHSQDLRVLLEDLYRLWCRLMIKETI